MSGNGFLSHFDILVSTPKAGAVQQRPRGARDARQVPFGPQVEYGREGLLHDEGRSQGGVTDRGRYRPRDWSSVN